MAAGSRFLPPSKETAPPYVPARAAYATAAAIVTTGKTVTSRDWTTSRINLPLSKPWLPPR